jgi:hypothetical protein
MPGFLPNMNFLVNIGYDKCACASFLQGATNIGRQTKFKSKSSGTSGSAWIIWLVFCETASVIMARFLRIEARQMSTAKRAMFTTLCRLQNMANFFLDHFEKINLFSRMFKRFFIPVAKVKFKAGNKSRYFQKYFSKKKPRRNWPG